MLGFWWWVLIGLAVFCVFEQDKAKMIFNQILEKLRKK